MDLRFAASLTLFVYAFLVVPVACLAGWFYMVLYGEVPW